MSSIWFLLLALFAGGASYTVDLSTEYELLTRDRDLLKADGEGGFLLSSGEEWREVRIAYETLARKMGMPAPKLILPVRKSFTALETAYFNLLTSSSRGLYQTYSTLNASHDGHLRNSKRLAARLARLSGEEADRVRRQLNQSNTAVEQYDRYLKKLLRTLNPLLPERTDDFASLAADHEGLDPAAHGRIVQDAGELLRRFEGIKERSEKLRALCRQSGEAASKFPLCKGQTLAVDESGVGNP